MMAHSSKLPSSVTAVAQELGRLLAGTGELWQVEYEPSLDAITISEPRRAMAFAITWAAIEQGPERWKPHLAQQVATILGEPLPGHPPGDNASQSPSDAQPSPSPPDTQVS